MNTLNIIILTLLIYSLIAIVVYFISGENGDVLEFFGVGIIGWIILFVIDFIVMPIGNFIRYYDKRSIFKEESTGNKYICKLKDTEDIDLWTEGYKIVKRYAPKSEWKDLPYINEEVIKNSKRNCNHCKYDKECSRYPMEKNIKCKHSEYGRVLEFDKFEEAQKTLWKQC